MSELTLVGLHDDGEHVVLEGPDGQRFRVTIDEALRATVRRDRPQLEQVRAELAASVRPREIQARIRAGASAEEVAEQSGMPVEIIRRYDGPVLAEREYIAEQAQATRIGHEAGAPLLGDLVTDRLATRDVAPSTITWDACRSGSSPWTVEVRFEVAGARRSARWTYDAAMRRVRALDDEARWLSETELLDEPIPRRHLAAVRDRVFDVEVDDALRPPRVEVDWTQVESPEAADPAHATHALLDDLAGRRGVRQELDLELDDEEFPSFGPQHAFNFDDPEAAMTPVPAAHPPASHPEQAVDARVLRMPSARPDMSGHPSQTGRAPAPVPRAGAPDTHHDGPTEAHNVGRSRGRKGRASVPSWDEIVFGAKHE